MYDLSSAGAASPELAHLANAAWLAEAEKAGIHIDGLVLDQPLGCRIAWAVSHGLSIGTVLSRFSTKMQQSTSAQVTEDVTFAAHHKVFTPHEFICVDEGVSGRKVRRDGLDRVKAILQNHWADTLLVYKMSRIFRVAHRGFQFVSEEVVEEGLRAYSVSQGIDTNDKRTWKLLLMVHGLSDEMLLETISDGVRSGLKDLVRNGYVVGAMPVGYTTKIVEGPLTKLGRPRRVPVVDERVKTMIQEHAQWLLEGMNFTEGWRRWVVAGGPFDPRSTTNSMTLTAYRRIWNNRRYTGLVVFGRMRNQWLSKKDYMGQIMSPAAEVVVAYDKDLRILEDDVFNDLQTLFSKKKLGPRGPKKKKDVQLWDLVTDCFFCKACSTTEDVRLHQCGSFGHSMHCKRGTCTARSMVKRQKAVCHVCDELALLIQRDDELIVDAMAQAKSVEAVADSKDDTEIERLRRRISTLTNRIDDLYELTGQGTEEDRREAKAKLKAAQTERAALQSELSRRELDARRSSEPITPEKVREILLRLRQLLVDGAAGRLGADMVYKAGDVFRKLVGGRIMVEFVLRPARKSKLAIGYFTPRLLRVAYEQLGRFSSANGDANEMRVWLRDAPPRDGWARRASELVDGQRLSYGEAAKILTEEGYKATSATVWQLRQRHFEILGEPAPPLPYNNHHQRKKANP